MMKMAHTVYYHEHRTSFQNIVYTISYITIWNEVPYAWNSL